jgi:hypothetical protein
MISEIRMINAALVFFDSHGKLIFDQSLKFPEIKLGSKTQVSDFLRIGDHVVLACKDDEDIFIKSFQKGDTVVTETKLKPQLKNPGEEVRSESTDNSSIRAWYGRYFYVYGYETIRDNVKRESRDVFYVNKVKVD